MVVSKQRALRLDTSRASEQFLRRQGGEFVPDGIAAVFVRLGRVDDFEDAMVERVGV